MYLWWLTILHHFNQKWKFSHLLALMLFQTFNGAPMKAFPHNGALWSCLSSSIKDKNTIRALKNKSKWLMCFYFLSFKAVKKALFEKQTKQTGAAPFLLMTHIMTSNLTHLKAPYFILNIRLMANLWTPVASEDCSKVRVGKIFWVFIGHGCCICYWMHPCWIHFSFI